MAGVPPRVGGGGSGSDRLAVTRVETASPGFDGSRMLLTPSPRSSARSPRSGRHTPRAGTPESGARRMSGMSGIGDIDEEGGDADGTFASAEADSFASLEASAARGPRHRRGSSAGGGRRDSITSNMHMAAEIGQMLLEKNQALEEERGEMQRDMEQLRERVEVLSHELAITREANRTFHTRIETLQQDNLRLSAAQSQVERTRVDGDGAPDAEVELVPRDELDAATARVLALEADVERLTADKVALGKRLEARDESLASRDKALARQVSDRRASQDLRDSQQNETSHVLAVAKARRRVAESRLAEVQSAHDELVAANSELHEQLTAAQANAEALVEELQEKEELIDNLRSSRVIRTHSDGADDVDADEAMAAVMLQDEIAALTTRVHELQAENVQLQQTVTAMRSSPAWPRHASFQAGASPIMQTLEGSPLPRGSGDSGAGGGSDNGFRSATLGVSIANFSPIPPVNPGGGQPGAANADSAPPPPPPPPPPAAATAPTPPPPPLPPAPTTTPTAASTTPAPVPPSAAKPSAASPVSSMSAAVDPQTQLFRLQLEAVRGFAGLNRLSPRAERARAVEEARRAKYAQPRAGSAAPPLPPKQAPRANGRRAAASEADAGSGGGTARGEAKGEGADDAAGDDDTRQRSATMNADLRFDSMGSAGYLAEGPGAGRAAAAAAKSRPVAVPPAGGGVAMGGGRGAAAAVRAVPFVGIGLTNVIRTELWMRYVTKGLRALLSLSPDAIDGLLWSQALAGDAAGRNAGLGSRRTGADMTDMDQAVAQLAFGTPPPASSKLRGASAQPHRLASLRTPAAASVMSSGTPGTVIASSPDGTALGGAPDRSRRGSDADSVSVGSTSSDEGASASAGSAATPRHPRQRRGRRPPKAARKDVARLWRMLVQGDADVASLVTAFTAQAESVMLASSPTLGSAASPSAGAGRDSSVAAAETVLNELDARWRESAQSTGFVIVGFLRGLIHHFRRQWALALSMIAGLSSGTPPVHPDWIPDSDCHSCVGCRKGFGPFRRKHHCRACGRIFCHACSSKEFDLATVVVQAAARKQATKAQRPRRVCDGCFNVLSIFVRSVIEASRRRADANKSRAALASSNETRSRVTAARAAMAQRQASKLSTSTDAEKA